MRAPFDSTIMNIQDLTEERIKLESLVNDTLQKKYERDEVIFSPFLLAIPLHAIYLSLVKARNIVEDDHRGIIVHLVEILTLQNKLYPQLTDIHAELTKEITENTFHLLQLTILHLTNSKNPIAEIWEDYKLVDELVKAIIIRKNSQDLAVTATLESLENLLKKLNHDTLANQLAEVISNWEVQTISSVENYQAFQNIAAPFIETLKKLRQDTIQHSFDHLTKHSEDLLTQIEAAGSHYIKQDIEKQIYLIGNDPWIKISDKKVLYCDLIHKIEILCSAVPVLQLSDHEQNHYCTQITAGFELTRDASFLNMLERFSTMFCSQNLTLTQNISVYIFNAKESIIGTTDAPKSILKRVHFSTENQVINIERQTATQTHYDTEPRPKKQRVLSPDLTKKTSPIIKKFINILNPVESETHDVSRRFVAALLNHIATSISALTTIKGTFKFLFRHYLLTHAVKICPEDAADLYQELKDKMTLINNPSGIGRMMHDKQKFSRKTPETQDIHDFMDIPHPIAKWFRAVLDELVKQIDAVIPIGASLQDLMEQLIQRLFLVIKEDKQQRINPDVLRAIQSPFLINDANPVFVSIDAPVQEYSAIPSTQATHTSISEKVRFHSLSDAIINANENGFLTWLDSKKKAKTSKQYLEFLIEKNNNNFTHLHSALHLENFQNFKNVSIYLSEVKSMMKIVDKYSFPQFLVSETNSGLTFLHLIAKSGNYEFLKSTLQKFKHELTTAEYARVLRIKTNLNYMPSCPLGKTNSHDINQYLDDERDQNPLIFPRRTDFFSQQPEKMTDNNLAISSCHPD